MPAISPVNITKDPPLDWLSPVVDLHVPPSHESALTRQLFDIMSLSEYKLRD